MMNLMIFVVQDENPTRGGCKFSGFGLARHWAFFFVVSSCTELLSFAFMELRRASSLKSLHTIFFLWWLHPTDLSINSAQIDPLLPSGRHPIFHSDLPISAHRLFERPHLQNSDFCRGHIQTDKSVYRHPAQPLAGRHPFGILLIF